MLTLASAVDDYLAHRVGLGRATVKNYRSMLQRFARHYGDRPIGRLKPADFEQFVAELAYLAPSTRRLRVGYLRRFGAWLAREGHVADDPAAGLEMPRQPDRLPRALDADQVAQVLAACPDVRAVAVVWLCVGLGLRCCEVNRARVEDWHRRDNILLVHGKGDRERELPVTAEVADALDDYLAQWPATVGPLVRSYAEPWRPLGADTVSIYVGRWMRDAGVKRAAWDGVSAHALRHTAASDVLDVCGDLRAVREMLGHRHLATTSIYLRHAGLSKLRTAMAGRTYRAGRWLDISDVLGDRARTVGTVIVVRDVPDIWALIIAVAFGLFVFGLVLFVLAVAAW